MKKSQRWKEGAALRAALGRLAAKRRHFVHAGKDLVTSCAGSIFPADIFFIATCNRALQNFDAFQMAMKADFFSTSMILLRVQLDSVLRGYGLTQTADPHETANAILNGAKLTKLKDKNGQPMTDANLVKAFCGIAEVNKSIEHIYGLTSGYVHLSGAAIHNVVSKSKKLPSGARGIYIGAVEPEVPMLAKLQAVNAFEKVTDVIFEMVRQWSSVRASFGDEEALIARYGPKK